MVGGLTFDVVDAGPPDGEAVLLLHGFPQTSWSWRAVWPALVEGGYRVLAPDQRGYSPGARPEETAAYAMPHLVGDALGVLDAAGVGRAHVVGHDWGAAVAWQLAARHPERVRTLTAVSVPHPRAFVEALRTDPDQRERSAYMRLFAQDGVAEEALLGGGQHRLAAFFEGDGGASDVTHSVELMRQPGVLTACLNWYRAQDLADIDSLPPVTVPTLHVWSDGDRALGRTGTELTAGYVDGPYRLEVLEGVSHWVPEQAADRLAAVLLEHVRAHS